MPCTLLFMESIKSSVRQGEMSPRSSLRFCNLTGIVSICQSLASSWNSGINPPPSMMQRLAILFLKTFKVKFKFAEGYGIEISRRWWQQSTTIPHQLGSQSAQQVLQETPSNQVWKGKLWSLDQFLQVLGPQKHSSTLPEHLATLNS